MSTRDRLAQELLIVAEKAQPHNAAIYRHLAERAKTGEFDATLEESEEWARKQTDPETVALMEALGIGPDRSRDQ